MLKLFTRIFSPARSSRFSFSPLLFTLMSFLTFSSLQFSHLFLLSTIFISCSLTCFSLLFPLIIQSHLVFSSCLLLSPLSFYRRVTSRLLSSPLHFYFRLIFSLFFSFSSPLVSSRLSSDLVSFPLISSSYFCVSRLTDLQHSIQKLYTLFSGMWSRLSQIHTHIL